MNIEHLEQTGARVKDAESTRLLGITPDMMDKIKGLVDRQMTVYG